MGLGTGDNFEGSPVFVRDGTTISVALKYEFFDNSSS